MEIPRHWRLKAQRIAWKVRSARPVAVVIFMFVTQAQPGDFQNWPFIREWANILRARL